LNTLTKIILFIFFAILIVIGTIGIIGKWKTISEGVILITTGFLCLIFYFLDKFESFEGFGIKGKLKQLDNKIDEADKILTHLKQITLPLAENIISSSIRLGRWDSTIPRRERYRLVQETVSALQGIGCREDEIEKIKKVWHWFNLFDQATPICNVIRNYYTDKEQLMCEKEIKNEYDLYKKSMDQELSSLDNIINKEELWDLHDELLKFIRNIKALDEKSIGSILSEVNEDLEDIKYYIANKDFRRKEHFFLVEAEII